MCWSGRARARVCERIVRECGERGALIVPVEGDLTQDQLGVPAAERAQLQGQIRHFFHLGALYDLAAEAADLERANVLGTAQRAGSSRTSCRPAAFTW